ncbi:MAG: DNA polymerase III subunit gamma/tau [Chloroflexi bacterium]|nr:DNA polymerase III subunit gamma/tau [Chloroflexota bacterium]
MSEVLYRKWRPQSFAEVVGQEPVTRTLRNSVASGRLAHAYLLCGPRGTGKTSLGRLIAKAANCAAPADGEPCNQCDSCRAFVEGRAMDFIEQDAASHNSVDDIRQLRENVVLNPMSGRYKVYLLDEVHMLSKGAENALLKTLEEPPPHIIFVLATTEPHKVEATVISRCQRFDLRRIPLPAAVTLLARICQGEGYSLDEASLGEIARGASGSLRDAINGLEQVVTYYGPSPSLEQVQEALGLSVDARSGELARRALAGDLPAGLKLIASAADDGVDMRQFSRQVVLYLRGLLLAKAGALEELDLPREATAEVKAAAADAQADQIVRALRTFGRVDFREDPQSSLPLELALVELVSEGAAAPPERKAEPRFSMPVAEAEAVAATAASARLEPPPEAEPEPASLRPQASEAAGAAPVEAPREAPQQGDLVEQVRQSCKETDKQLSALLNGSCEVKSLEGDVVTLGFYHTFHLERIESGPYASRLAELFGAVLGRPVKVAYVHAPRASTPGRIKGGHLVQAARELGARPVLREAEGPIVGKGEQGGEPRDEP